MFTCVDAENSNNGDWLPQFSPCQELIQTFANNWLPLSRIVQLAASASPR